MKEKLIYIFRHGETDWNYQGKLQGHSDIPLNEIGTNQAHNLALKLADRKIEAVLSSDLSRAYQTAAIVANELHVPVSTTAALREMSMGVAEGLTREEVTDRFGEEFVERMRSVKPADIHARYPNGESKVELLERAQKAIHTFIHSNDYVCIGISTHGGVLRHLVHSYMAKESEPIPIPNCAVYQLCFEPSTLRMNFMGAYEHPTLLDFSNIAKGVS